MFGCYTPRPDSIDITRVFAPRPTGSRVWFNVWDSVPEREVRYLALDESPLLPVKRRHPRSLMPTIPFPGTQSNEPWLFSSCSMKHVAEVTICQDASLGHRPIIGMQLGYIGGHRACVGQFRFDMVLRTIRVEGTETLYIGSRRTKLRFMYVASVTVAPPADDGGELAWTDFHGEGKLEWWFSSRHSIVRKTSDTESQEVRPSRILAGYNNTLLRSGTAQGSECSSLWTGCAIRLCMSMSGSWSGRKRFVC